jgi:hypothetical protein
MNVSAQRPPLSSRILAFVLQALRLFGIAVGCLVILTLIIFIAIKNGIFLDWRWIGLSYWTGCVILLMCRLYEPNLKQLKFWFTLFCLSLTHVIAFIAVLQRYPEWRLIWYVPIVVIESQFMGLVLDAVMRSKQF